MKQSIKLMVAGLLAPAFSFSAGIWTGAANDGLWNNPANWKGGVPTARSDAFFDAASQADVNLNAGNVILSKITFLPAATPLEFTGGSISLVGTGTKNAQIIQNQSGSRMVFQKDVNVTASTQLTFAGGAGTGGTVFNGAFSSSAQITFSGTVTFNGPVKFTAGALFRSGEKEKANLIFANTVNNEIDALVMASDSTLTVNTAAGVVFYAGQKIQHNSPATLIFNHANVLGDTTVINANGHQIAYTFNADETLGALVLTRVSGEPGAMILTLGDQVKNLCFAKSTDRLWAGGSLTIKNFREGVIGFGSDANGLTAEQMKFIKTFDSSGTEIKGLALDKSGRLVKK